MTYIPAQVDKESQDLLERVVVQLKKVVLHLASMSDENITDKDVEE